MIDCIYKDCGLLDWSYLPDVHTELVMCAARAMLFIQSTEQQLQAEERCQVLVGGREAVEGSSRNAATPIQ
jgi:hypothetical protein